MLLLSILLVSKISNNVLNTFLIKGKPTFSNVPSSLPKNLPDCMLLDSSVFDNFILPDDNYLRKFYKVLKLVYQSIIIYEED